MPIRLDDETIASSSSVQSALIFFNLRDRGRNTMPLLLWAPNNGPIFKTRAGTKGLRCVAICIRATLTEREVSIVCMNKRNSPNTHSNEGQTMEKYLLQLLFFPCPRMETTCFTEGASLFCVDEGEGECNFLHSRLASLPSRFLF